MARPSRLEKPAPSMVYDALRASPKPMTAYDLLSTLKPRGINSPPIIYRALDALQANGSIHKVQALNAYVACDVHEAEHHTHSLSVITVCGNCETVTELHDHAVYDTLHQLQTCGITLAKNAVIELPVECGACQAP